MGRIRRRLYTRISLTSRRSSSFACSGLSRADDVVEIVREFGKGGGVWRLVGVCGEPAAEVGFPLTEGFEAHTVALDALVAIGG